MPSSFTNGNPTMEVITMRVLSLARKQPAHAEGRIAKAIENQTARLPSDTFLWAAGASIIGSLALKLSGRTNDANFVGEWAPTLLILGLYNKMVKQLGSD
jgi:hypothetical protein